MTHDRQTADLPWPCTCGRTSIGDCPKCASQATAATDEILDRMEDLGDDRHIGWWSEDRGYKQTHLHIEVTPHTVLFACCEGERAEKRIIFVTGREKALGITRALLKALGDE